MPLQLDHTIVPAYDKVKSAEVIAQMFGLKYEGPWGHFAPVKVNDILTLDFDDSETLAPITTPSWPRTRSSTRSCSGSRTRGLPSGAGRARGRTGRSTISTRGAGSTSKAGGPTSLGIIGGKRIRNEITGITKTLRCIGDFDDF